MSSSPHISRLFTESGCLKEEAMQDYLLGRLTEEEQQAIAKHLAYCPLCTDALEGMKETAEQDSNIMYSAPSPEINSAAETASPYLDGRSRTSMLNARLRSRFNYDPYRRRPVVRGPSLRNILIPAAASIIILVGIIGYFHYFSPEVEEYAMVEKEKAPPLPENKEKAEVTMKQAIEQTDDEKMIGGLASGEADKEKPSKTNKDLPATTSIDETSKIPPGEIAEESKGEKAEPIIQEEIIPEEAIVLTEAEVVMDAEEEAVPVATRQSMARKGKVTEKDGAIFSVVENMPEFPGGPDSLSLFLARNLRYPEATENNKGGTVYASFTVNKKGRIRDIHIIRGIGEAYDEEVMRVLKLMPDWKPGSQRGKAINVQMTLPVIFNPQQ